MAVSNSTDFSETAQQIIIDARNELGIANDEEPLEAVDLQKGLRALNRMLKAWQADGVMAWTLTEGSLVLTQGQAEYDFGSGGDFTTVPFDITDARMGRNSTDLPMTRLSREEYFALPNKMTEGYPTNYFYDRQRNSGKLYVWPAPDATTSTFKFTYRRIVMDLDNNSDDFDTPQEWTEALVFGLAARMVGMYGMSGKPAAQRVQALADATYSTVKGFDVGEGMGSVRINPAGYGTPHG